MRFMVMVKATADSENGVMPDEKLLADMGRYNEELVKAGIMQAGDGLHPSSKGARVRFSGTKRTVIDGPFTDRGLASLAGLDGVAELDLFWHVTQITSDAFAPLAQLPNLTALGADGRLADDRALAHIAAIPRLRRLRIQESLATHTMRLTRSLAGDRMGSAAIIRLYAH